MGVVHHANYLVWMEIGRVELVRARGCSYKDLEQTHGLFLSVVEANCRYLYPANYDQEVAIQTEILSANPRVLEFGYEMRLGDTTLLAKASTRHVWLNRDWRPTRLPEHFQAFLYVG